MRAIPRCHVASLTSVLSQLGNSEPLCLAKFHATRDVVVVCWMERGSAAPVAPRSGWPIIQSAGTEFTFKVWGHITVQGANVVPAGRRLERLAKMPAFPLGEFGEVGKNHRSPSFRGCCESLADGLLAPDCIEVNAASGFLSQECNRVGRDVYAVRGDGFVGFDNALNVSEEDALCNVAAEVLAEGSQPLPEKFLSLFTEIIKWVKLFGRRGDDVGLAAPSILELR